MPELHDAAQVAPLLHGLDWSGVIWTAFWAALFGMSLLPARRRWNARQGQPATPWWVVALETLGGVAFGTLAAMGAAERWPELHTPGAQGLISVGGSILGPWVARWLPYVAARVIELLAEKKIGVKFVIQDKEERDDQPKP